MRAIRAQFIPPTSDLLQQPGQILLKDGTAAELRITHPSDVDALRAFLNGLSSTFKRHHFFSQPAPLDEILGALSDSSNPGAQLTLVMARVTQNRPTIVAACAYQARDGHTAELSLAVDDAYHGHGIGTILVQHLALLAVRHGFTRLRTVTHADNWAMREVFCEAGFPSHEHVPDGHLEIDLLVGPTEPAVAQTEWRQRVATVASLRPFFHPRAVAVIGASANPTRIGYRLLDALLQNRFAGRVYP
ncbi:MAG TPA: GNAT family N-acetyltransferase, partial [Nitrospiraceae bacterium]|nr:GNAT family N-acetyltransferase [Nitrospiraceae bacterium]